jgi:3',5'-cyclic AMP phosphodiesterase CpdA
LADDPYHSTHPLTFAVCADIHQDIMHDGALRLQAFVEAAADARVDMAVQLGDFCQPTEANRPFLDIWQALALPRYNVLGNHDMDGGARRQQTVAYMSMPDRYYSFATKGWHFAVLDGNDPSDPPRSGYACGMAADQIDWLGADLRATDLPVVIFIHQAMDRGDLDSAAEVLTLLDEINRDAGWQQVVAVFSGHHHLDYATCLNGIWHIQVNSMSNYWMGGDFLQVRYGERIDATFPYIKYTAPYKDPLFALVRLEPGATIHIEGVDSEWVGPSPGDLGFLRAHGASLPLAGASVRPGITTRLLQSPTDQ